ncbi:pentatricopeptide repeat (PPR) superfamily protein [Wolffia australiana]
MLSSGAYPDDFSFSLALKSCSRAALLPEGLQLHGLLIKSALLHLNVFLHNSLISFYRGCSSMAAARQLFDRMPERDSISCNLLIHGYSSSGDMTSALEIFNRMEEDARSTVSWNSMICGYSRLGCIDSAFRLFDEMPERDSFSWNSMIDGLVKAGRLEEAVALYEQMPEKTLLAQSTVIHGYMESGNTELARALFDEMPERDLITYNIMISGYANNGRFQEALALFRQLPAIAGLRPDATTIAAALSAIGELGLIQEGLSLHAHIQNCRLPLGGKLGVALIDMYAKCGRLEAATAVFEAALVVAPRSVDHWNAMIGGLAAFGHGRLALRLVQEMERLGIRPDDITFIEILNACSHSGLVEQGLAFFSAMEGQFGVKPKVQHYGCVVDILGRAGRVEEARKVIESMPMEANEVVWRSLLSACLNHGRVEAGCRAGEKLLQMDGQDSSSFVLLSNLMAGGGLWGDRRRVRGEMKARELRKPPGCSWVELDDAVHEFFVGG